MNIIKKLFFLTTLYFGMCAFGTVQSEKYKIESDSVQVTVSSKGEIIAIFDKQQNKSVPFTAKTFFTDCEIRIQTISVKNGTINIIKEVIVDQEKTFMTTENLSFEGDLLKWELVILPIGDGPWSTLVQTIWSVDRPEIKYWTTWGDPRPEKQGIDLSEEATRQLINGNIVATDNSLPIHDWTDPLVPQPLFPRRLVYGGSIYGDPEKDKNFDASLWYNPGSRRNYFSVPLVGLFDEKRNTGISLGFSPSDIGIEASLEVTKDGELVFSRYNNRFTPGKELRFTSYIELHEADWRASLGWYVKKFQEWFNPVNPNVDKFSGTSSYSYETGSFDVKKMKQMAYKTNWDATFPFPYMGLFLPDVEDDEGWLSWRGEYLTFKKIDDYYKQMQEKGFHVLSYFNVTEFGSNILKQAYNKREPKRQPWVNSNTYLNKVLEPAVLFHPYDTTFTKYIYSWDRCIIMDPGEPVYMDFMVGQINRYIEKLPHFEGITIDRLDWTRLYNTRRDDGVSWFNDAPARSLHVSWNAIMDKIAPILHKKNKVLFINNHVKRLDDIKLVDGIFDEFGDVASSINTNAFLCVNKPLLGWCHNKASIGKDFDAFMQKYLHLGMYPMAPFPANDHALLPDPEVDRLYLDYGPMLKLLKGKNWVLESGAVEVLGNKAKANIFKTDMGTLIPVTFGTKDVIKLKIKNIPTNAIVEYLHLGSMEWKKLKAKGRIIKIPLHRRCAMVLIRSTNAH